MDKLIKLISCSMLAVSITACDVLDDDDDDNKGPTMSSSSMASSSSTPAELGNIAEVAVDNGSFDVLVRLLGAADLAGAISDETQSWTVFAPTDAAFAKYLGVEEGMITEEQLLELEANESLAEILLYHVIPGNPVSSETARTLDGMPVNVGLTEEGPDVVVSEVGQDLYINLSKVVIPDVPASNGVIHVIDTVLVPPAEMGMPSMDIVETAQANGNFTTLLDLLGQTGLDAVLANPDEDFTVFAPTDDVFAALPPLLVEALLRDTSADGALYEILTKHVIQGLEAPFLTALTLNGTTAGTVGGDVSVNIVDGMLQVGGANVVTTDIYTTNGVIHVIDAVITEGVDLPTVGTQTIAEIASADGRFGTLVGQLANTPLLAAVQNPESRFTVFAPTDEAFAKLGDALGSLSQEQITEILEYHVYDGVVDANMAFGLAGMTVGMLSGDNAAISSSDQMLYLDTSLVTQADVVANNGIIHVIDTVMMPAAEMGTPTSNIVEVAVNDPEGRFDTLVSLLLSTELDDVLGGTGPFTVFAPTDDAFAAIDSTVLANLQSDTSPTGTLYEILTTHVISGEVNSTQAFLANGTTVGTVSSNEIGVSISDGTLMVGGANVVIEDIYTTNGVIHVIDSVILEGIDLSSVTE